VLEPVRERVADDGDVVVGMEVELRGRLRRGRGSAGEAEGKDYWFKIHLKRVAGINLG
jgi:hypothetical protein